VQAFLAAWRAACDAGNATLLFPKRSFAVGAIEFAGPCGNGDAPVVVINGVLQPGGSHLSGDAWITFSGVKNLLVTGAGTLDSRGFHLNFRHSSRIVVEGLHIVAPAGSSNTDGIHVALSNHVRILYSVIGTGDDCVSVCPGSTDVVVHGVVCGPGHGISVGSLGKKEDEEDVRGLVVRDCTLRGTTNGVRIKTWPGSPPSRASNITFEDITMADVSNPIIIDQRYCPHGHCNPHMPSLVQISDVTFRHIKGTSKTKVAVQVLCSSKRPCTGVRLVDISLTCGSQPCSREIVNGQAMPARLEEEADVVPGPQQSS
jgi:galacturan 1,4-alpha-galacturonidase